VSMVDLHRRVGRRYLITADTLMSASVGGRHAARKGDAVGTGSFDNHLQNCDAAIAKFKF
jgi:hypothetical protein